MRSGARMLALACLLVAQLLTVDATRALPAQRRSIGEFLYRQGSARHLTNAAAPPPAPQFWILLLFTDPTLTCDDAFQSAINLGIRKSVVGTDYFPSISQVLCNDKQFYNTQKTWTAFNILVIANPPPGSYAEKQSVMESAATAADLRQQITDQLNTPTLNIVIVSGDYINQPADDVPLNAPIQVSTGTNGPPGAVPRPASPPPSSQPVVGGAPGSGSGSSGGGTNVALIVSLTLVGVALLLLACVVTWWLMTKKRQEERRKQAEYASQEMTKLADIASAPEPSSGYNYVSGVPGKDPPALTPTKAVGAMDATGPGAARQYSNSFPRVAVADSVFAQKPSPDPAGAHTLNASSNGASGSPGIVPLSSTPGSATESLFPSRSQIVGMDSIESSDLNDSSLSLRRIKTSGKAARAGSGKGAPMLPSAGDAYPLSAECAKMSSREVHRRLRSQSLRAQAARESDQTPTPSEGAPSTATGAVAALVPAVAAEPRAPLAPRSHVEGGYRQTAPATLSYQVAPPLAVAPALREPERSTSPTVPRAPAVVDAPAEPWNRGGVAAATGAPATLKAVRRKTPTRPTDEFSSRIGQSFSKSVAAAHQGRTPRQPASPSESDWGVSGTLSVGHSASSFSSVSVMSEATTVYTEVGQSDVDDKVTAVERLLNRAQQELGGQVGSFRLKGPRYRFAGRSSVVAFAEGMWGGDYALKFYCDPKAAEREFSIYRQSTELNMSLPEVYEIEDNAGGVLRLKDGTPLPPFLAMLRGLPLPEWYSLHVPSQLALLETLAQVVKRLEQLHASGFCHNDIKPANILLLDGPNGGLPRWHLVDFTTIAQSGSQIRARYTLEYVSPEFVRAVAAMRAHQITCQRSMDVWSLGVIMYELMTCEPFFPLDAGRDMMRDGLMGLEPLPIEENPRSIMRIPKEGRLRTTIMSMLSREPASRPSATKVLQSIRDCIKELTGESPNEAEDTPVSSIMESQSMVNA